METIDYEKIRLELDGALATIRLVDPDRLNALTAPMAEALLAALQELAKPRRGVRALLITGEGRGFCAGVNLAGRSKETQGAKNLPLLSAVESLFHPLIRRIRDLEIPVVAAINGPCVGIGLAMALLADYVVASSDAYFLVPFRNLGSCTDSGLSWLLPRVVGPVRARQMIMRAERVPAAKALDWGMINEVVAPEALAAAGQTLAAEFAAGPTVAIGLMKTLVSNASDVSFDQQLEAEARGVARTSRTKDNNAALRVFGTKEKPVFIGA